MYIPLGLVKRVIYAWEGLKKQHFRWLQFEVFRLNHASPERIRWVWNTPRKCLKGLRSSFSIYFVIFEKKSFQLFSAQRWPNAFNKEHYYSWKNGTWWWWCLIKLFLSDWEVQMSHVNELATAEFFINDSVSAHGNDLHEKCFWFLKQE